MAEKDTSKPRVSRYRSRREDKKQQPHKPAATTPSTLRDKVGQIVQQHRIKAGLTQSQLAEKASLSLKYVGEVERGEANMRLDTLDRLAREANWDIATALLNEGTQTLSDGVRLHMLAQLDNLSQQIDGIRNWLRVLSPVQAPLKLADAQIPAPPSVVKTKQNKR